MRTATKFTCLAPPSAGRENTKEEGREREDEREKEAFFLLFFFFAPRASHLSLGAPSMPPSIEETKKRLSLPTHHVHAPVLVDDGSVRIVDPASIGRRQVERGPLRAARGLLPPLGLRRREHCFNADAGDPPPLLLRSSASLRPSSLRGHEKLAAVSASLGCQAAVACGGVRRCAQHREGIRGERKLATRKKCRVILFFSFVFFYTASANTLSFSVALPVPTGALGSAASSASSAESSPATSS